MNRIALFLFVLAVHNASAIPVLFHEGVPTATPLVGEHMSANRLIWQSLDASLVVKVTAGATARYFRFPGAYMRRGQVFIRDAHGLEGLVGKVGDRDSATPPNYRIDLDSTARLNIGAAGVVVVTEVAP